MSDNPGFDLGPEFEHLDAAMRAYFVARSSEDLEQIHIACQD